jgi:hypothetical protein
MWDMRRSIDPDVFPRRRIVVQFEYPDAPRGARNWWLVSEKGQVDLCLDDHGYEIDIVIRCSLKAMSEVWICQRGFNNAVSQGDIAVLGDARLARKLQSWLRSSGLATLGSQPGSPQLAWQPGG